MQTIVASTMSPKELVAWRKAHGMSAHELAEMAGVSWRTVHRWERGEVPIPKLLELVCEFWTTKGTEQMPTNWRTDAYNAQQDAERSWIEEGADEARAQVEEPRRAMTHEITGVEPFRAYDKDFRTAQLSCGHSSLFHKQWGVGDSVPCPHCVIDLSDCLPEIAARFAKADCGCYHYQPRDPYAGTEYAGLAPVLCSCGIEHKI